MSDAFWIGVVEEEPAFHHEDGARVRFAEIQYRELDEMFLLNLETWTESDYERQWAAGVARILRGERSSCLISHLNVPGYGSSRPSVNWYALYRRGDLVFCQEHLLLTDTLDSVFDPNDPYAHVAAREPESDVSEWVVSVGALQRYLETQGARGSEAR